MVILILSQMSYQFLIVPFLDVSTFSLEGCVGSYIICLVTCNGGEILVFLFHYKFISTIRLKYIYKLQKGTLKILSLMATGIRGRKL